MKKSKEYSNIFFAPQVLAEAFKKLSEIAQRQNQERELQKSNYLKVSKSATSWVHDNDEEFFADYSDPEITYAHYGKNIEYSSYSLSVSFHASVMGIRYTSINVECNKREDIESVFNIFEKNLDSSKLPEIKKEKKLPKIFVGHGKNNQWRDLKDHLQDKHQYKIEAYEVGARAGHEIRDVLQSMLQASSFAILVMTGEDEGVEGKFYPRGNVVHELGLFQGGLGFDRAIVLLEQGTEEFSNINGVTQIRFPKGKIKETFGDVVATIRREFE